MRFSRIALVGNPGAGKDTFVQLFQKTHPHISHQIIRLAAPLYEVQDFIYNICSTKIEKGAQDGALLNFLGKHMRSIHPNVLLDRFAQSVQESTAELIFCSDARPVDIPFIKQMGFTIIHIATEPSIALERRKKRGDLSLGSNNHGTEQGLSSDMYDYQIQNNHTLEEFEHSIALFFKAPVMGKSSSSNSPALLLQ